MPLFNKRKQFFVKKKKKIYFKGQFFEVLNYFHLLKRRHGQLYLKDVKNRIYTRVLQI